MAIIPYGKHKIEQEDIDAVVDVLKNHPLTQGPKVKELEDKLSSFLRCSFSVAVSNGTTALHLASLALGITEDDTIITTPNTFVATANGPRYTGAKIELVDIDSSSYCISFEKLEKKLQSKPYGFYKAIFLVSFAGFPCNIESFGILAKKYGSFLVEDACHALGGEYTDSKGNWTKSGSSTHSDLSVFSFHPVKHIAAGEGGLITTNNPELYNKLIKLRTHGITNNPDLFISNDEHFPWSYEMQELGYNYRLSDIQSTLALSQMTRFESNINARRSVAQRYDEELSKLPITLPKLDPLSQKHGYHLYVICTDKRLELYNFLRSRSIFSQVHYIPVYQQPYYSKEFSKEDFPNNELYYSRCLSIPMFHTITTEEQDYVILNIKQFFMDEKNAL